MLDLMLYISLDTCPILVWSVLHWCVFYFVEFLFFIDMILYFFTVP